MTPRAVICLFAKPPEPGRVKTRLARVIGAAHATRLAGAFLRDAWQGHVDNAARHDSLTAIATTGPWPPGLVEPEPELVLQQGNGDLGARIEHVLRQALARAPVAIAVGADSPGLPARLVDAAFDAMTDRTVDAVLGPAEDGGFYLLAVRACPHGLLADLPWSTAETFDATHARLVEHGLRVIVLESWFDIDEVADLARLQDALEHGDIHAPQTRRALDALDLQRSTHLPPTTLSVIVPVLDEAARVEGQLRALLALDGIDEIVVADGGSTDDTVTRARAIARTEQRVRVVGCRRGRAHQQNEGAAAATGDVLLFLHADVRLPPDARRVVDETLARPGVVAGAFRTWTVDDTGQGRLGPLLHLADVRSRYTGLPYGDQAIFMRREVFERVGGFPALPLMEDLELGLRLRRLGRIAVARARVEVSGRRFIERPIFYTALVNIYPLLYRLGVPADALARFYLAVR